MVRAQLPTPVVGGVPAWQCVYYETHLCQLCLVRQILFRNITYRFTILISDKYKTLWPEPARPSQTFSFIAAAMYLSLGVVYARYCRLLENVESVEVVLSWLCSVPPSIEVSDRVVVVTERDTAELPCVAVGFPQPTISWIKDGRLSLDSGVDGRYDLQQTGSLRITDVQVA